MGKTKIVPHGWVSIEDHLPMFMAGDIFQGGSTYLVRNKEGQEMWSVVSDHNVWYFAAKDNGVTEWFNGKTLYKEYPRLDDPKETFSVNLTEHLIDEYKGLIHMTPKSNVESIIEKGLLRGQEQHKSLVNTGLLFVSYPVNNDTRDLFRYIEDHHAIVTLDIDSMKAKGITFYDDYWGRNDASSLRNHLACDDDIPVDCIKSIYAWDTKEQVMAELYRKSIEGGN